MRLVVDASVAVKWLVAGVDSDTAREVVARGDELHAPRLMACETANAVWRKARLGEIELGEASAMAATVREMPIRWNADETVAGDAVRLALALDRPVSDCVYLALAHRIGGAVVTADHRFANALAPTEHGGAVVTLADYAATRA